ncbi:MAG: hypothetical protein CM15mV8_2180 [Caudoviricetes sp.]|nr:MAG: hypothetical protein CM15mV8_2180 [Caudoviricetes sp.]
MSINSPHSYTLQISGVPAGSGIQGEVLTRCITKRSMMPYTTNTESSRTSY